VDDRQADAIAIADNRLGEMAEWDGDELAALLRELEADGADMAAIGYDESELAEVLAGLEPDEDEQPEDPGAEEPPEDPDSERGEVYELGQHRLICGDCRDAEDVARLLDGTPINVAFTSPPYASQRKYDESSGFEPIPPDEYVDWFDAVQANVREHLADDGSWFVNIKEHCDDGQRSLYVKDLTIAHVRAWGWRFVDELCWQRNTVPGKFTCRFKNGWEPVFHFTQGPPKFRASNVTHASSRTITYDPAHHFGNSAEAGYESHSEAAKMAAEGDGVALPYNIVSCSNPGNTANHSAQFPVALPAFFIKAFSDEGDAIFDPFLGSGTTLIAAAQNKRIAFGCEISEGYCDVIRRRWTTWADAAGVDAGRGALRG